MSFTNTVKEELAHVDGECSHCEKATLAALVRIEGSLIIGGPGRFAMEIATDVSASARLILRLLHGLYGLKTTLTMRRSVLHKTPNYLIEIPSQPGLETALGDLGILGEEGGLTRGIDVRLISKRCCKAAYLRGAFLGSGFISNPRSDFHFEITVENRDLAQDIALLMREQDIGAKIRDRRNLSMIYLKSGTAILEFLAFVGAHQSALLLEEERVVKSLRNDVNRQINAEMANQQKASAAAVDQLFAIRQVLESTSLESLPPALQEFIRLRVTYPDATLSELGSHAKPPLSKSAIAHRVRRIESLARAARRHDRPEGS